MPAESVLALTAHAREVPAAEREPFAATLRATLPPGSILLVTCHRVEGYFAGPADEASNRLRDALPPGGRFLTMDEAARHLLSVAVGRDSVVLGEDEILHQLREALASARATGTLDPAIDRLFALALRAGRRARSWQQGRRRSLGDVAVGAIERTTGPLTGRSILVVGAGKMGGLAARAAARAGGSVVVANRTPERARALADAIGGAAVDLDPGADLARIAGVIVALGAPWEIAPATATALAQTGAVVVDLSFPSAVPIGLATRLGDRLVSADELAFEDTDAARPDPRLDELIDQAVQEFADWQTRGDGRAAADALVKRADRAREIELDALWRRIPALEPETRAAIEGMTRHLAARLLQPPLERLGRDPDGRDGKLIRDLFAL